MMSLTIISLLLALTPADTIPTMVDIPGTRKNSVYTYQHQSSSGVTPV